MSTEKTTLLVRVAPGVSGEQEQALVQRNGGTRTGSIPAIGLMVVDVPNDKAAEHSKRYQDDSQVRWVENNGKRKAAATPNDAAYGDQWALPKIGWESVYGSINPTRSASIAVLDTGVDASIADLSGRVGGGFSAFGDSSATTDPNGHGTWLASIAAAATNNGSGIAGVGYAGGVSILPVKVLDANGMGNDSDIIAGVTWAADNGASVILMGFSNPGYSQSLQAAIDYAWSKGAVVVAATGNAGSSEPNYPAGHANVVGVAATDHNDALWSGSNYGASAFLAAPGVGVVAGASGGGTATVTGTSASAAVVAGVAALLRAHDGASNGTIVGRLARNADPAGTQGQTGNGRVNLARAIADTSTAEVVPTGAPAAGGPFVGPYVASAARITAKTHQGQEKPAGTYTSGNVTTYSEGDFINFRFTVDSNEASSGQLQVRFTGNDGTCLFFTNYFQLGTITTVSGATPTVTTVGTPVATDFGTSNGEWVQTLNISFSGAGEAIVNYTLQLSDQAGECNGSSQHSRLNPAGGAVVQTGQQNVPVPANQVIELPEITVIKRIDRDGDGTFEALAAAGEFCFKLDNGTCVLTDGSGQVVFTNVTPDGAHTIVEEQKDFTRGTYAFVSGTGTNCTFTQATATATVASGTTSTDATCTFNNRVQKGSIIVEKQTVPDGSTQTFTFTASYKAAAFTLSDGQTNNSGDLAPGTYSVAETVPAGWDLTSAICSDGSPVSAIALAANETVTCTFTNTQRGAIVVEKQTDPDGSTQVFTFTASYDADGFSLTDGQSNSSGDLAPGTYSVAENAVAGWDLESAICSDGSPANAINLAAGETVTCIFTNTERGSGTVIKTVSGAAPPAGTTFTFEIRTGASPTELGTTVASDTTDASGNVDFGGIKLRPGAYQLCETNMLPGWATSLSSMPGSFVPNSDDPLVDNSIRCVGFTIDPGENELFTIDNTPPPGGDARTIGFWRNWSSCTGGRQRPVLDETLASFSGGGVYLGKLLVDTCQEAVRILSKSTVDTNKNMASDAAYGLAAQLLAAVLNVQKGAETCPAATQAIADGQALLNSINFTGSGSYLDSKVKGSLATKRTQANTLASTLDRYNNNLLCN